jgi:fatty-acyl-CoA synthase
VPDENWSEVPKAFAVTKPGVTLTAEDIVNHCKQHLARFKALKTVKFGELPKTSTREIQKFKLRDKEWAGRERRVK